MFVHLSLILCLAFLLLLVTPISPSVGAKRRVKRIVGGVPAAQPPPDDPVVFTRLYNRNARVEGFRSPSTGLYSYLGIRYAESPAGENRFLRPSFRRLSGDINATQYGPPCPQPDQRRKSFDGTKQVVGDEDCLLLNVFTPRMPDESTVGLPVLVFIHGGGFRFGSANQYGPDPLTSQNILFVPIQYRLGTLGILGDGSTEFSGNAALFDMATAVRWVHEYISFFGGDPAKISIIGHGSGATSAVQLSMSDAVDENMINGVVAMSGSAYTQHALDDTPKQSVREIAQINNCDVGREVEMVRCLRKVELRDIVLRDTQVQMKRLQGARMVRGMNGMAGFGPVVQGRPDGRSLPSVLDERPDEKLKSGKIRRIPLLTGVTKHETAHRLALPEIRSVFHNATDFLGVLTNSLALSGLLHGGATGGVLSQNPGDKVDLLGIGKVISLKDYLHIPSELDPTKIIAKLTEATTDALFNLPALLTTQAWAKVAPSFLYSFEHIGHTVGRGSHFLSGLPIVSQPSATGERNKHAAHGDDLAFLFDTQDLFGQTVEEAQMTNTTDLKVRSSFTGLIAQFLQSLNPVDKQQTDMAQFLFSHKPTLTDGAASASFIKIGSQAAEVQQDFRFCELSMFGAKIKPMATESCKSIIDQLLGLGALTEQLQRTLGQLPPTLLPNFSILGGESLPTGSEDVMPSKPKKKTKANGGGMLGGLLRN